MSQNITERIIKALAEYETRLGKPAPAVFLTSINEKELGECPEEFIGAILFGELKTNPVRVVFPTIYGKTIYWDAESFHVGELLPGPKPYTPHGPCPAHVWTQLRTNQTSPTHEALVDVFSCTGCGALTETTVGEHPPTQSTR
jgi:hypothetical protein